jgi:hypothetical protein
MSASKFILRFDGWQSARRAAGTVLPRIVVKTRRNDIDTMPDDQAADAIRGDLTTTPRVFLTSG